MEEDGIKFDYAQVSVKATAMRNILDKLNAKFSTMKEQVANMPNVWSGDEAAVRFKTKLDNFTTNFDKFGKEMESYVACLEEISSTYSKLEEEIVNSASVVQ